MPRTESISRIVLSDDLEPIMQRGRQYIQIAFARAARAAISSDRSTSFQSKSMEDVFLKFLQAKTRAPQRISPRIRRQIAERVAIGTRLLTGVPNNQDFRPFVRIDFNSSQSLKEQVDRNDLFKDVITEGSEFIKSLASLQQNITRQQGNQRRQFEYMVKFIRSKADYRPMLRQPANLANEEERDLASNPFTQIRLNLLKVECLDEVDWEITDYDKDEIMMGGKFSDTGGTQKNINEFKVGEFKQGDVKNFGQNPHTITTFELNGTAWPRYYFGVFALSERDLDAGFIEFLQMLWDAIDEEVIKAVTSAVTSAASSIVAGGAGAAVGAGTGAAGGTVVGSVIGTIIGTTVGALVGFAIGYTIATLKDDIFEPAEIPPAALQSALSGFDGNGSDTSDTITVQLNRDGASYKISYNWTLHRGT